MPWWLPQDGYPLGYLLRKLPRSITFKKDKRKLLTPENSDYYWLSLQQYPDEELWVASYDSSKANVGAEHIVFDDTPEDAVALLCIKLFEEGIL